MQIDKRLEIFFKERAIYYKEFIDSIANINFVILNLYDYGIDLNKVSGDLDIVIDPDDYKIIQKTLVSLGFFLYIKSNTNQYQWIKYVENIGIVQIHIHLDFCFFSRTVVKFEDLQEEEHFLNLEEEYVLFCIQTFYKNKYNNKIYKKYEYFYDKININKVKQLIEDKYYNFQEIISFSLNNIKKKKSPQKYEYYMFLVKMDAFSFFKLYLIKVLNKIKKIISLKSNDVEIIFMGVDGAGKSTTIENIKLTLNNEIMYKMHYFGLKTSIINKLRSIFSKEKEIKKTDSGRTELIQKKKTFIIKKVYFLIIGIFYWIEYNIKYLFYIRLNSITASTVHLIDRSYYDALLYYDIKFLDILFFKFSFKPDALIYLTGDTNLLYERKKEITKKEIDFNKSKYESLMKKFTLNQFRIKVLDSTINDEIYIRNIINLEIFEFLKERA